jgi:hypothetical protein
MLHDDGRDRSWSTQPQEGKEMRRTIARVLGILALSGAAPAFAGNNILYTAPALHVYPTDQTLYCDVLNVGSKPVDVTIEILDYFGVATTAPVTSTLQPGQGNALGEGAPLGGAYCRFTSTGSKKTLRGVAVYDDGSTYTMAIPAQ